MSVSQLVFGIVLAVIGLGVLPFSRRLGRHMDREAEKTEGAIPAGLSLLTDESSRNSAQVGPFLFGGLAVIGVVLIVTAFTAH